jgi:Zn-dependent protease
MFGNGTMSADIATPLRMFLLYSLIMNVSLAVFNLLPFPPLDGSKILQTFLPESMQPILTTLEQYGFLILMVFIYMGLFSKIFEPIFGFVIKLLLM